MADSSKACDFNKCESDEGEMVLSRHNTQLVGQLTPFIILTLLARKSDKNQ